MILKLLKQKTNQNYINKLLATRKSVINDNKVKSVAVLFNEAEFDDFKIFRQHFKDFKFSEFKIFTYVPNNKPQLNKSKVYFSPNDFGWHGTLKNAHLKTFTDEVYDVLISFYNEDVLHLQMITALSNANFKIGLSNKDERLYDLIINVNPNQIEILKKEFKKYLKILKKI